MRENAEIGPWQRRFLYSVSALLWLSGSAWLYLRYAEEIEAGPVPAALMKVHGAAVTVFLVVFGMLLAGHVRPGWLPRRRRASGVLLILGSAELIITGWLLYYSAEPVRPVASAAHATVGLVVPVALAFHIFGSPTRRKIRKIPS